MVERETWTSRSGFILAAVGSAVGLGNIWRFPWMTAENGGAAFLLFYLIIIVGVGIPGLLVEHVIGRRSNSNPFGALKSLSGSDYWGYVGILAVFASLVLLSFYSVVGGWIIRYFIDSFTGAYLSNPVEHFQAINFGTSAVIFHLIFLAMTAAIVYSGVRKGIEKATKIMIPVIFVLLILLAFWAATLTGAGDGYAFYLSLDFAALRANWLDILLSAGGQALFTLSLGVGSMITYASYIGDDRSLPADGTIIAGLNTFVGVLTGFVVFPILFSSLGEAGSQGPGALFIGIASAFNALPLGSLIAIVFFGIVLIAALSSSISMLEIPVAYLADEHDVKRERGTTVLAGIIFVTGSVTALYPNIFDFVAGTLVDLLLTFGLFAFCIFVAWVLGRDAIEEFRKGTRYSTGLANSWLVLVGTVLPVFLLFTLLAGIASLLGVSVPAFGPLASNQVIAAGAVVLVVVVVSIVRSDKTLV